MAMVNVPKVCSVKWHMQTMQTEVRLVKEQSDQGLHCLPFCLVF